MPGFFDLDFAWRLLNIIIINLALSGDNAIVIGMAAASLPHKQRKRAILVGGVLAIFLRIILTSIASYLMLIPLLSAAGGLALIWVAYKLLRLDVNECREGKEARAAKNFRQAIVLILAADFMMSLDNVIAVAGTAHGNFVLIIIGLLISMPIIMFAGGGISFLIDKFRWLVFAGAFAITFTAIRMILEDQVIESLLALSPSVILSAAILIGFLVPLSFVWLNRRKQ